MADPVPTPEIAEPKLIVVYRNAQDSLGPLRWAIRQSKRTGMQLIVVHSASIGISVHNGPSASIAHTLGNPTWATAHSVTKGLGAPADTQTIVESTPEHELIDRYWTTGSNVVVASSWHRRQVQRRSKYPINIVTKPKKWIAPAVANYAEHELVNA